MLRRSAACARRREAIADTAEAVMVLLVAKLVDPRRVRSGTTHPRCLKNVPSLEIACCGLAGTPHLPLLCASP